MNRSAVKPEALARHLRPPGTLEGIAQFYGAIFQFWNPVNWWLSALIAATPARLQD